MRRSRARHSQLTRSPSRCARRARNDADRPDPVPEWGGPSRSSLGRALRLIATAGTAAGGMCLVLAMVAWVAMRGAPHPAAPGPASSGATSHASPSDRSLIWRTIATYRGAGPVNRRQFQVSRPGNWGISWEFRCPAGRRATFSIRANDGDSDQRARVDTGGSAGRGIYWNTGDPGDHSLLVTSRCPWTVRVVLPRLLAGHQGASSPPAGPSARVTNVKAGNHGPKVSHPKKPKQPKQPEEAQEAQEAEEAQAPRESRPRLRERLAAGAVVSRRSAGSSGSA